MAAPIVVRHSELKDFRRCPLKHRMKWVEGWRTDHRSDASGIGTAWHAVMETHYNQIQYEQREFGGYASWRQEMTVDPGSDLAGWEEAIWSAVEPTLRDLDTTGEQQELLQWMYEGYVELRGLDPDWEILGVEQEMTLALSKRFTLQVHIDLTAIDHGLGPNGTLLAVDNKSTASPLGQQGIDLDDQFGLYSLVLSSHYGRHAVPVINQAKTKKLQRPMTLTERHDRRRSFRTKVELENIRRDALAALVAMHSTSNRIDPYSNPDPRTCDWSCEFLNAHIAARKDPRGLGVLDSLLPATGFVKNGVDNTLPGV